MAVSRFETTVSIASVYAVVISSLASVIACIYEPAMSESIFATSSSFIGSRALVISVAIVSLILLSKDSKELLSVVILDLIVSISVAKILYCSKVANVASTQS